MTDLTTLTGSSLIAGHPIDGKSGTTHAVNPATGENIEPAYTLISEEQLREATQSAQEAFASYSVLPPEERAAFLAEGRGWQEIGNRAAVTRGAV